jgi:hypothetical protein
MPLLLLLPPAAAAALTSPQPPKLAAALISYSSRVCRAGASADAAAAAISVLLRHQQLPPLLLLAPLDPAQPVTSFQSSSCTPMQGVLEGLPSSEGLMAPTASWERKSHNTTLPARPAGRDDGADVYITRQVHAGTMVPGRERGVAELASAN